MSTTTIPWNDGSGDNIYLTSDASEGNQTVLVSSDVNSGEERTKTIDFTAGSLTQTLTVTQEGPVVFYNYLLYDGTAYIDTDIVPPENFSIASTIGYETALTACRVFGVSCDTGSVLLCYGSNTSASTRQVVAYYGSTSYISSQNLATQYLGASIFMTPNGYGWGDSFHTYTKGDGVPNAGIVFGSIHSHSGTPFYGGHNMIRIFGANAQNATTYSELTTDYTPYRTLRPCKYNGESGLWNVEEKKFYGNSAGSGSLIACTSTTKYPASYDTTRVSYYSLSNVGNAYASYSSTSYATITLKRGASAETYIYFKFDFSNIPENATIYRIVCSVRANLNTVSTNFVSSTRNVRFYCGTTAKGTAYSISSNSAPYIRMLDCGTWTREELDDMYLRFYVKRSSNTSYQNNNYYLYVYGVSITVFYE